MKIEVEEQEILDMVVKRFAHSEAFKRSLEKHIINAIDKHSKELMNIGYRKALREMKGDEDGK